MKITKDILKQLIKEEYKNMAEGVGVRAESGDIGDPAYINRIIPYYHELMETLQEPATVELLENDFRMKLGKALNTALLYINHVKDTAASAPQAGSARPKDTQETG